MRILYSHRIQSRDGQSVHMEELIGALRQAGHEVCLVGPRFYDKASFGGGSRLVSWLRARLPRPLGELAELFYNVPAYWRLHRAWREFQPDLIYERYNLYYLAGVVLARRRRTLFYLEVNAPLAEERSRFGGLWFRRIAHWLEAIVWRGSDRVLVVSQVLGEMVSAKRVPAARVMVVPNGIAPERFEDLRPRPAGSSPIVLGFVGFVRDWHGLDAVIAAMAAHAGPPIIELLVVGDGPARPALQQQAIALGIAERVHFSGLRPPEEIPALVAGFDIALQPRVVAYASPLKLFDYMAAGRAIVAPNQPNITEVLTDGETALLFDADDPAALWATIMRLARDAALRRRLGDAARAEIKRRDLSWNGNARRVVACARLDLQARTDNGRSTVASRAAVQ